MSWHALVAMGLALAWALFTGIVPAAAPRSSVTHAAESDTSVAEDAPTISDVGAFDVTTDSAKITWTVSVNATGQVEYGPTTEYGSFSQFEPSFTWATHIQQLSDLEPGTEYHFRVMSSDPEGREVISDSHTFETIPLETAAPGSIPMAETFGPAINADSLNNSPVGGPNQNTVAYRFRATETSALDSIRVYIMGADAPGYGAGTGGTLRVTVQEDDGSASHHPSSVELSSATFAGPRESEAGFVIPFDDPPALQDGELYHVVFANIDDEPGQNYVSVNGLFVFESLTPDQPAFSDVDWANQVRRAGGEWSDDRGPELGSITPIMALDYANGRHAGQGYMEVWNGSAKTINGPRRAKQTFTMGRDDRLVSSISVRLKRVRGDEPLTIELLDRAGDVLESGAVPAAAIAIADPAEREGATWARFEFEEPRVLESGQRYEVIVSSGGDSEYAIFVMREGSRWGYPPATYFVSGRAQYDDGSGWIPFDPPWHGPIDESDLQLFFE